jgi:hypothetical protein
LIAIAAAGVWLAAIWPTLSAYLRFSEKSEA